MLFGSLYLSSVPLVFYYYYMFIICLFAHLIHGSVIVIVKVIVIIIIIIIIAYIIYILYKITLKEGVTSGRTDLR